MTPETDGPTLVILAAGRARRYGGVKPLAPVGLGGEAVIDLLASDALAAGWGRLVLVIGPETGPAIRYHVEQTWPGWVNTRFCLQALPRGTVDAVMAAAGTLSPTEPFGVANADDLYGQEGLALLAESLPPAGPGTTHTMVAYRLRETLVGTDPVTRGVCQLGPDSMLVQLDERRKVAPTPEGTFVAHDERQPAELDGDGPVSVNLWGFAGSALHLFSAAMDAAADPDSPEVLLPEVIGRHVADGTTSVRVVEAPGRCIGVTHPGDLSLVRAELAGQIGGGERPATLWAQHRVASR